MRFPFRRSVGDDLRALFEHDRLDAQANHLGHASLSPGEGSFDILDANGNVVAVYGHHAGKAGFLVPKGSGWQSVQEAAAEAVAGATAPLTSRLDDHAQRIGSAENKITALQSGKVDQSTHNALAGRVGAAENDIAALQTGKVSQSTHNALAGRVGAAENDISALQSGKASQKELDFAQAQIDAMKSKLNTLINAHNGKHPDAPVSPLG